MNILTLDFETYYDQKYSLSKVTTEEYVRSELFEAIGVSVQVDDGTPESLAHRRHRSHPLLAWRSKRGFL